MGQHGEVRNVIIIIVMVLPYKTMYFDITL